MPAIPIDIIDALTPYIEILYFRLESLGFDPLHLDIADEEELFYLESTEDFRSSRLDEIEIRLHIREGRLLDFRKFLKMYYLPTKSDELQSVLSKSSYQALKRMESFRVVSRK